MWSADQYIENLYKENIENHTYKYDLNWQVNLKNKFRKSLGDFEDNNEALNPVTIGEIGYG